MRRPTRNDTTSLPGADPEHDLPSPAVSDADRTRAALSLVGFDVAPAGRGLDTRDLAGTAAVVEVDGHPAARTGAVVVVEVALFAVPLDSDDVTRLVELCDHGTVVDGYRWLSTHPHAVRRNVPPATGPRVRLRRRASHP